MHACCWNCCKLCKCNGDNCSGEKLPFNDADAEDAQPKTSKLCEEEKHILHQALKEYQTHLNKGSTSLFGSTSVHGFSNQLVQDIISNADNIFTLDNVLSKLPVFSTKHAKFILGIFQDIFQDIEGDDDDAADIIATMDSMGLHVDADEVATDCEYLESYYDCTDSDSDDPDMLQKEYSPTSYFHYIWGATKW